MASSVPKQKLVLKAHEAENASILISLNFHGDSIMYTTLLKKSQSSVPTISIRTATHILGIMSLTWPIHLQTTVHLIWPYFQPILFQLRTNHSSAQVLRVVRQSACQFNIAWPWFREDIDRLPIIICASSREGLGTKKSIL